MRTHCVACLLTLLAVGSTPALADMGGLGPAAKIGTVAAGTNYMGSVAHSPMRIGTKGVVKAMEAGLVGPSTDNYIGTIGGTIKAGKPQFLSTAPIGGMSHALRYIDVGTRSIDLLPRGYEIPKQ